MDKVGLPRSIFYYYDKDIVENFLSFLNVSYIVSPKTTKAILEKGTSLASSEMCLPLKIMLGHIDYLKDKCEYILVPRFCNTGKKEQMCTNFMSAYDLINNLFDLKLLNYNIDYSENKTLKKGLYKIGKELKCKKKNIRKAYKSSIIKYKKINKKQVLVNQNNLNKKNIKILLVSHPYNIYDDFIGSDIVKFLEKNNIQIIYSNKFDSTITSDLSNQISKDLYFKFSKENIGSIIYVKDKIDGIIFLSSFPCAPDSLVTEITERSIDIPNINLIIDDNSSFAGLETRLESFIDILKEKKI